MTSISLGEALKNYKENSEITVLEPGEHRLECTSAKAGVAKGGPTITPVFKVVGGPLTGRRVMVGKLSFAEGALWKTIPQVKGFGLSEEFLLQADSAADPFQTIADAMVGRVVDANVNIDAWQGEDRNKLVSVRIAEGHVAAPAAPAPAPGGDTSGVPSPTF